MESDASAGIVYGVDDVELLLEQRRKFSGEQWSLASAYDSAITVAGYGAFFGLWAGVAKDITPVARAATAFLMGTSLLLYILWTLGSMVARHRFDAQFAASMKKNQDAATAFLEWDAIERTKQAYLLWVQSRFWLPVFGTTVFLGLSGTLVLIYNSLAVATGLPQLTGTFQR